MKDSKKPVPFKAAKAKDEIRRPTQQPIELGREFVSEAHKRAAEMFLACASIIEELDSIDRGQIGVIFSAMAKNPERSEVLTSKLRYLTWAPAEKPSAKVYQFAAGKAMRQHQMET